MKKVVLCVLAVVMLLALTGCESIEKMFHPGQSKIAGVWVNDANVQKWTDEYNKLEAEDNGDTYCSKCKKFIEGKVRICPHCGKYI